MNMQITDATSGAMLATNRVDTNGGTYIAGDATVGSDLIRRDKITHGDEIHGDKIAGDKVTGDKITNIYVSAAGPPDPQPSPLLVAEITRQPFEPETLLIPAGPFIMGDDEIPTDTPRRTVELPVYRMGKTAVTNDQYAAFLKANPAVREPDRQRWFLRKPKAGLGDHPVVNVTWHDAQAYCVWLSQAADRRYQLPSEAQWEKAARGPGGRIYPWGERWQDGYANVEGYTTPSGSTAVTTFGMAAGPYGCLDLLGNVQEWTSTAWGDDDPPTAYDVRGGSYRSRPNALRCSTRESIHPDAKVAWRGFRVVLFVDERSNHASDSH